MPEQTIGIRSQRIDLGNPDEVQLWTSHYGCTQEQLCAAVEAVGPLAQDVREFIAKQAKQALKNNG